VTFLAVALAVLAGSAPKASLKVTYWPHGRSATPTVWTLKCAPAAGTHPAKGRACTSLAAHSALLGPATKACTILSPRNAPMAEVVGTYAGQKVDRSFRIGCPGWTELKSVLTGA
jgi:hypothetical protein